MSLGNVKYAISVIGALAIAVPLLYSSASRQGLAVASLHAGLFVHQCIIVLSRYYVAFCLNY